MGQGEAYRLQRVARLTDDPIRSDGPGVQDTKRSGTDTEDPILGEYPGGGLPERRLHSLV